MLPIAGIQKLSLVDYPGNLCAIVFLQGCNLRCPYCHNVSLVSCDYELEQVYLDRWAQVFEYLRKRREFLEGVCITGGEPTIHSELPNLIHEIKQMGYKIKLDTNGTNPGTIELLLREGQLDYVAMDIKTSLDKYYLLGVKSEDMLENIKRSIKSIMLLSSEYEFRTTVVPGLVGEAEILSIARLISGAHRYVLQAYRSEYVLEPEKSPAGAVAPDKIRDYVELILPYVSEIMVRGYGDNIAKSYALSL